MNETWKEIPKLDTLDFDALVKHRAKDESVTEHDILNFLSSRISLQAGLELLGVPLFAESSINREKHRSEPLLIAFEDYLTGHGYTSPEFMWEPGTTILEPFLEEEAHRIGAINGVKRRQGA